MIAIIPIIIVVQPIPIFFNPSKKSFIMKPVKIVINTYLRCKDMTKDELIKEMKSLNPDEPFSQVVHETLVYLLYDTVTD